MIEFSFRQVKAADFEELLALRILVMQEHLERIGRFEPDRARQRFAAGFDPQFMRKIIVQGRMAGVVSLKTMGDHLELEHFYLHPDRQNGGLGGAVLARLIREADEQALPIRLGVLQNSPAAVFYERHGFAKTHEEAWDVYYHRPVIA